MLDAQKVSLLCSKDVTFMRHYAYLKKIIFFFNAWYIEALAMPL